MRVPYSRCLAVVLASFLTGPVLAQGFQWPERATDLEVLPSDTPGDRLRGIMQSFTRALGVRCSHCHLGEEGQPLSEYDFVSDERPAKNAARVMMRMTRAINGEYISSLGRPEVLQVTCETCHRGMPRPTSLAQELAAAHAEGGMDAALERYRVLHARYFGGFTLDFRPASLDSFAALLADEGHGADAAAMFRFTLSEYPTSADSHVGLGHVLLAGGDRDGARAEYQAALALDPESRSARGALSRLDSND